MGQIHFIASVKSSELFKKSRLETILTLDPYPEIRRNISATCSAETSIFFSYFGLVPAHQI